MAAPVSGVVYEVHMSGLIQTLKLLKKLPLDLQRNGLRNAMRAGATVVRKAAINNMKELDDPNTTEKVFRNIVVQFASRSSKKVGGVVMRVGILGGAKQYGNTRENVRKRRVGKTYKTGGNKGNPGGDTWYWRFLEFGIPSRGIEAKRPMLRALEQNSQRATEVVVASLDRAITAAISRGVV